MTHLNVEEILAEYADGFLRGDLRIEDLIKKYNIPADSDLAALLDLAHTIEKTLTEVQPAADFVEHLRLELMADRSVLSLVERLRHLSGRQMMAGLAGIGGLTFAAGVYWWVRRSLDDTSTALNSEGTPALAS